MSAKSRISYDWLIDWGQTDQLWMINWNKKNMVSPQLSTLPDKIYSTHCAQVICVAAYVISIVCVLRQFFLRNRMTLVRLINAEPLMSFNCAHSCLHNSMGGTEWNMLSVYQPSISCSTAYLVLKRPQFQWRLHKQQEFAKQLCHNSRYQSEILSRCLIPLLISGRRSCLGCNLVLDAPTNTGTTWYPWL